MFSKFSILDIAKAVGVVCLIYFLVIKVPTMFNSYIEQGNQTTITQVADGVPRAVVVTSDVEVKEAIKALHEQTSAAIEAVKELGDKVTGIGNMTGKVNQNVEETVVGDYFDDGSGSRDLHTFLVHSGLETDDGSKMPIATVYYSPEIEDRTNRVSTDAHKIEFKTNIIEAISKDGKPTRTAEAWVENNWSAESKGKRYPIGLYIDDWSINKPPKSLMWNFNLTLSTAISMDDIYPGIGLSLLSYGHTKKDADWRFVNIFAAGSENDILVGVMPVLYNAGNYLPLVSNLFVGPFVGYDFEEVVYGVGIVVPF